MTLFLFICNLITFAGLAYEALTFKTLPVWGRIGLGLLSLSTLLSALVYGAAFISSNG